MKIESLDPNFARHEAAGDLTWVDVQGLGIEGRGWNDTATPFDRLPARAKALVREPVWNLSLHSAGLAVRFITDAPSIAVEWKLRCQSLAMGHMPAMGVSGMDLYIELQGAWRWCGSSQPTAFPMNRATIATLPDRRRRHFMLYLPLYNGVESVQIGVPANAEFGKAAPYPRRSKPIVIYGTSIVQGGCASRTGLAYTAILGRRLQRPVINLGFSGNGPMDLELARLMAEIDAGAYLLDPLPNMNADMVRERTEAFVDILRQARPKTPIVLVENITYQRTLPENPKPDHVAKNKELGAAFKRLKARKVPALSLVPGARLLGSDWEGTVDGVHPNDIGFMRMADVLAPALRRALR